MREQSIEEKRKEGESSGAVAQSIAKYQLKPRFIKDKYRLLETGTTSVKNCQKIVDIPPPQIRDEGISRRVSLHSVNRKLHLENNGELRKSDPQLLNRRNLGVSEVMCLKCLKMVCVDLVERHSAKCYYHGEIEYDPQLTTLQSINLCLNRLEKGMEKSQELKEEVCSSLISELIEVCRRGAEISEGTKRGICQIREQIVMLVNCQRRFPSAENPLLGVYLDKLLQLCKRKNAELGKQYNRKDISRRGSYNKDSLFTIFEDRRPWKQTGSLIETIGEGSDENLFLRAKEKRDVPSMVTEVLPFKLDKMAQKRKFYTESKRIIQKLTQEKGHTFTVHKDKLFNYIQKEAIPEEKWEKVISEICQPGARFYRGYTRSSKAKCFHKPSPRVPMSISTEDDYYD